MPIFEPRRNLRQHLLARHYIGALHLVGPEGAGVFDVGVDVAGGQRVEDDGRAQPIAPRGDEPFRAQPVLHEGDENVLLGERLGTDDVTALSSRQVGDEGQQNDEAETYPAGSHVVAAARGISALDQRKQLVDGERQHRRSNAAEQHEDPVLRLQAGKDVVAETGLADRSRKRSRADHPHGRCAHARHDHRQGQGQLDHGERLPLGHADAERRPLDGRVDALMPVMVLRTTGSML